MVTSIFAFDAGTPVPSAYVLLPVAGTVLVLYARSGTMVVAVLSFAPFVWIGLISYGTYLWHQPLLAFARLRLASDPAAWVMPAIAAAALPLAWLTYRFVERPFRARGPAAPVPVRALWRYGATAIVAFLGIGVVGQATRGFEGRAGAPAFVADGRFALPTRRSGWCFYDFSESRLLPDGQAPQDCRLGSATPAWAGRVLLFGDSHAAMWEPFWHRVGSELGLAVNAVTTNWCFPALGAASTAPKGHPSRAQCAENRMFLREAASRYDLVVLGWDWADVGARGFAGNVFGAIDAVLQAGAARAAAMAPPVYLDRSGVERSVYHGTAALHPRATAEAEVARFVAALRDRYAGDGRVILLDRMTLFGSGMDATVTVDGYPYSLDGSHISIYGADSVANRLLASDRVDALRAQLIPPQEVSMR